MVGRQQLISNLVCCKMKYYLSKYKIYYNDEEYSIIMSVDFSMKQQILSKTMLVEQYIYIRYTNKFLIVYALTGVYFNNQFIVTSFYLKLHTSELQDGYDWGRLNLQSVTEQNNLDDFLTTAEMAGKEFTAGRWLVCFCHVFSVLLQIHSSWFNC